MVKGGDAFDTMLKNNQEQSTSGHVSCRHCGAVLFRKKDSPLQGNLELSAKVSRSARNLKNFVSNGPQRIAASQPASGWSRMSMLYRTAYEHTRLFYINYRLHMKIKLCANFPESLQ
jgi:hypothetical protein